MSVRAQNQGSAGFTLIELMIAVAIVGILATIAYPSYTAFVRRANRTDATRTLQQDAQSLQRCYSQNFSYTPAGGCPTPPGTTNSPDGHYSITIAIPSSTQYTLTATPQGSQTGDSQCVSFTLVSSGQQSAQNSGGSDTSQTCWGSK